MTGMIVFAVSFLVTLLNIGLRADFIERWLKAFITGWPLAAAMALFAIQVAR
jgi:hypothetical protein